MSNGTPGTAPAGTAAPSRADGQGMAAPGTRSSDQIRDDIVRQRQELSQSVDALRSRWTEITNVRRQLREHRTEIVIGAAAVGFLVGGIVALTRRRSG